MSSLKEIYEVTTQAFLSPVLPYLNDDSVTEIMINGAGEVFYEKAGTLHRVDNPEHTFPDEHSLMSAANNIAEYVGRHLSRTEHSLDGRLPKGHRVHVIVPPASRSGVTITIRKFKESRLTLDNLIEFDSVDPVTREYLRLCVLMKKNIVVSGGTGTGKTSMLNAVARCIPDNERIIVIEDTSELKLDQPHVVYLEAQPAQPDGCGQITIRDLFVDSLRMRPDRIIVGEVRRGEALDLVQSMISGHAGSLSTVHANTPRDAAIRLETLCLMSDVELPLSVARTQVASAVDVVLQLQRYSNGKRKVSSVSELKGVGEVGYQFQPVFSRENAEAPLLCTKQKSLFSDEITQKGMQDEVELTSALFLENS